MPECSRTLVSRCSNLSIRQRSRIVLAMVGAATCGVLIGGLLSPSWAGASDGAQGAEPAVLGGFALGDGVEGLVDAPSGAFSFALPVAGVSVAWDSRAAAADRSGLGAGWSMAGVAKVDTEGGVRVSPASGGVFPANATVPSGLEGYVLGDVVFRQLPAELPARADGLRGAASAAFELVELGGVRTFFTAAGDPVVRMDANGNRTDWEWGDGHRLQRVIDAAGVVTALDWADPARVSMVTGAGAARTVAGTIELDGGRVSAVVDASGGRVRIGYGPSGLVDRVAAVSGTATEVSWQGLPDGRAAVDRIRVIDAGSGAELSTRQWTAQAGLASGWPAQGLAVAGAASSGPGARSVADGYTTSLSDGVSTVTSEFDGRARLLEREVESATRAGSLVQQRQAFAYPEVDDAAAIPPQFAHPTEVTVTQLDATGGQREATETFEFDELGRMTELTNPDGDVTTSYDYTDYGTTTTRNHTQPPTSPGPGALVGDAHRNPFQYAGEYTNPTGTQHLQIRTYDPATMRLTSTDPEPQHNRYHYAALNPITLADPTGRIPALPSWATAVLAGVGVALALTGFAAAISAVATAASIGAATVTAKAVLTGAALVSMYDLAATALDTVDTYIPEFLDDETALILGVTSAGAGLATAVAGFGARALSRVDINRAIALDPVTMTETHARLLVVKAYKIAVIGQSKLKSVGIRSDRTDLMRAIQSDTVERIRTRDGFGGWSYGKHQMELDAFEDKVNTWKRPVAPAADGPINATRSIRLADTLAQDLRNLVAANDFATLSGSRAVINKFRDARDAFARNLAQSKLYPKGVYEPGTAFYDEYGNLILHDTDFFGFSQWKFVLREMGQDI